MPIIRIVSAVAAVLFVLAPAALLARQQAPAATRPARKAFAITRATSAIVVDGTLDEAAWASATSIPLIYEWQPATTFLPPPRPRRW